MEKQTNNELLKFAKFGLGISLFGFIGFVFNQTINEFLIAGLSIFGSAIYMGIRLHAISSNEQPIKSNLLVMEIGKTRPDAYITAEHFHNQMNTKKKSKHKL